MASDIRGRDRRLPDRVYAGWLVAALSNDSKIRMKVFGHGYDTADSGSSSKPLPTLRKEQEMADVTQGRLGPRGDLANPLLFVVARAAKESCRYYARGCKVSQPDQSFWCVACLAQHVMASPQSDASASSPTPAESEQPHNPYGVVVYREEAAKMAFDAIQSALQGDWAEHYSVLQVAGMIAANIRRISPAAPAERTRAEGEQDDRDPLADMMMPIIYKAAVEPCRNYARGCPENQPDQSFWCAPCEAREAKEIIESDPEIVSRYCLTAPADNDAESSSQLEREIVVIDGERRRVVPCPDGRENCEVLHTEPAPTTTTKGDRW